jgi:6-phosphogluconolactonase
MAYETLLAPLGIPSKQVHRMRGEATDLDAAAEEYQRELATITGSRASLPSLDLILLGMGADGHTASLFPGTPALRVMDRWVVANTVTALETTRLTLTFPVILAAQRVHVLVSGAEKADVLKRVLEGWSEPDVLPAQRLRESGDRVLWLIDADAARSLERVSL